MSMAMFAQIKALELKVSELQTQYADLLARLAAIEQKKTIELPRKSA
jgi:hypothetical protein